MRTLWERFVLTMTANVGLKSLSLVIALALWLFVNAGQKAAERAIRVPVELRNVPADLLVINPTLEEVEVRTMGPAALLSTIDPDQLKVVLDLDAARPGTSTFRVTADSFNVPRNVRITRISPSTINLKLESLAVRSLPVKVRLGEKPPFGYRIAAVETTPEAITVRGAASDVNRMHFVETQPFDPEPKRGRVNREVRLDFQGKDLSLSPDRVVVSIVLEEEWITKEFQGIKIKVRDGAVEYKVSPAQAYFRLSGPKRLLVPLRLEERVYLDLKGLGSGSHLLPLTFDIPPEVKVVEQKPSRFRVRIDGDLP